MNLHTLSRKVKRNVEDYGLCIIVTEALARLLSPVYVHRVYRIYRRDLTLASPKREGWVRYSPKISPVSVSILTTVPLSETATQMNPKGWLGCPAATDRYWESCD